MGDCTTRRVKARKYHRCLWCSEGIDKGEVYVLHEWVDGNEHGRNRFHAECDAAHDALPHDRQWDWYDEGCVPDFERGHTHEEGWDTVERQAADGCPACKKALKELAERAER